MEGSYLAPDSNSKGWDYDLLKYSWSFAQDEQKKNQIFLPNMLWTACAWFNPPAPNLHQNQRIEKKVSRKFTTDFCKTPL